LKIALVTPPTNEHPITRDMAGGLGFDRDSAMLLPPLDFLYAASQLRNEHQEVLLIDGDHTSQFQGQLQKNLEKFAPDIVLVMVSLPTLKSDCAFAKGIRGAFACQVAIRTGISHPPVWEEILNKSRANFLVFGECEIRIGEILSGKFKAGTAWIERNKLHWQTGINISQLDSLPLPDWGLLGKLTEYRYPLLGNGVVTLQTSRGCPFPCSFYCPYPLVQGHEWRAMTSDRMFSEVCNVFQYGISRILFRDAVFTYDRNRTIEFCEKVIHEHLPISGGANRERIVLMKTYCAL